ncbi:MAG: prepilin-type N-terminal cleavage/methylation domain-containing protein [bacterium]
MKFKKGFTLIEIVVVIGIIGVLTVIILPSLSNVRARNRDTERISDIGTIQLGLLNYYSKYGYYPQILDKASTTLKQFITPEAFIDPSGNDYNYVPLKRGSGTKCTYYHLGTTLESQTGQINSTDTFSTVGTISNGYQYCGTYSGSGIAPPDFISNPKVYNYNVHP